MKVIRVRRNHAAMSGDIVWLRPLGDMKPTRENQLAVATPKATEHVYTTVIRPPRGDVETWDNFPLHAMSGSRFVLRPVLTCIGRDSRQIHVPRIRTT
jgi:hypothetical protein